MDESIKLRRSAGFWQNGKFMVIRVLVEASD